MNSALAFERLAALTLSAVLLGGCAYTNPYVLPAPLLKECNPSSPSDNCKTFPTTTNALASVNKYADDVRGDLTGTGGVTTINRWLGMSTFALVTALAVKTAHTAPASATKNLALGGGAAYTASNLFASSSTESLYLTTHASLICIAGKGDRFLASYSAANSQLNTANSIKVATDGSTADAVINNGACEKAGSKEDQDAWLAARDASTTANAALDRARSLDATMGQSLMSASNSVLTEMNRQLLAQNPSIDAISQAGKSAGTIASGLLVSTSATGGLIHVTTVCPTFLPNALSQIASQYNGIRDTVVQALNSMGDLSTGCSSTPVVAPAPLAVNQSEVQLAPGKAANLVITGGRPFYIATWVGDVPNEQTELSKQPIDASGHLLITELAAASPKPYYIQITDSAVVPSALKITVNVNPAPAAPAPAPAQPGQPSPAPAQPAQPVPAAPNGH